MILLLSIIISIYVATQYLHISVLNSLMANTLILRALASLAAQLHDGFQKVEPAFACYLYNPSLARHSSTIISIYVATKHISVLNSQITILFESTGTGTSQLATQLHDGFQNSRACTEFSTWQMTDAAAYENSVTHSRLATSMTDLIMISISLNSCWVNDTPKDLFGKNYRMSHKTWCISNI